MQPLRDSPNTSAQFCLGLDLLPVWNVVAMVTTDPLYP